MPFAIIILILVLAFLFWRSRKEAPKRRKNNVIDIEIVKKDATPNGPFPYKKRQSLLSRKERHFYEVLLTCMEEKPVLVFLKVRALDLLSLPRSSENYLAYINRIIAKQADFVVVHSGTLEPLVAVVLTEATTEGEENDNFLMQAFQEAGLPLLVLKEEIYNPEILMQMFQPFIPEE